MQIISTKKFDKQYRKLEKETQQKFNKRVTILFSNLYHPSLNTHKLHGKFKDCMSINVTGDIRAVFQLKDDGSTLLFVEIGSHSDLYS